MYSNCPILAKVFQGQPDSMAISANLFDFTAYERIEEAVLIWESLQPDDDIYLNWNYLRALQESPPEGMESLYVVARENGEAKGLFYFQHKLVKAAEAIPQNDSKGWKAMISSFIKKRLNVSVLTLGNMLQSGQHGFEISRISLESQASAFNGAIDFAKRHFVGRGKKVDVVMVKDFYSENLPVNIDMALEEAKFTRRAVQPCMKLKFEDDWNSFADYENALHAKYRTRLSRAYKKSAVINRVKLNEKQIEEQIETMNQVHCEVCRKQSFSLFELNPAYFMSLKKELGDNFDVHAYYLDGEMVAFTSDIKNGDKLEAHFLGLKDNYNTSHQLYLTILFDFIKSAFEKDCREVNFSRTAMEIKSSVGATPHDAYLYVKHTSPFVNFLVGRIFSFLEPKSEWTQRHPFK